MTVQVEKVVTCGIDFSQREFEAFDIVQKCLAQLSNALMEAFDDDIIYAPEYGPEYQISDIAEAIELIKNKSFGVSAEV